MKINYLKQAWASLRQQPVVSIVSVIGTALAIFLIMVVVMIDELKTAPFAPESNRDRWLVQKWGSITNESWGADNSSNGPLGYNTIKQVPYRMETPEAVAAFSCNPGTVSVSVVNQPAFGSIQLETDEGFWKVFDFTFIEGKPYTKEDFDAGLTKSVFSHPSGRQGIFNKPCPLYSLWSGRGCIEPCIILLCRPMGSIHIYKQSKFLMV